MNKNFSPKAGLRTPNWAESATRWTQLTLVEDDPNTFDVDFWLDVFDRTRSNATCLSAGGYVAFYPSKIPLQHVSRHLGDSDPFGDLVKGARDRNMHVVARVDPHAVHADVAEAHPEWISVTAEGELRRHWSHPEAYVTCAWGGYNRDFMSELIAEVVTNYDIDAIFANRWSGHGVCYCAHCTADFRAKTGHELPRVRDPHDAAWQAWLDWSRTGLTSIIELWNNVVSGIRSHARFIPNAGYSSLLDFDLDAIRRYCPILFVDHQGRTGTVPAWAAGRDGKRMRGVMGNMPIGLVTATSVEEKWRWKDSVQAPEEIRMWMTNGMAHNMRPWFTKFNGKVHDNRWLAPIAETFNLHADLEPEIGTLLPTADIAVLDPSTTLRMWPPEDRGSAESHELGLYHALVEARLPFDLLSDLVMDEASLARYRVIAVANAAFLSDTQCAMLDRYVRNGGSLVASFETSFYDEHGQRRPNFGLADLFGVDATGDIQGPSKNDYVSFDPAGHPITAGFDGAERIMGGTRRIPVRLRDGAQAATPLMIVPHFPDLPMEEIYVREPATEPAAILRELPGGGRVAYFPWNLGEVFWDVLAQDHAVLFENTVRWALGDTPRVEVEGQGVVEVALREAPGRLAVQLVNLTNPMMMKGPIREVIAVGPQSVSVVLPAGIDKVTVRLLVAGVSPQTRIVDGRVHFTVPSIATLEVAVLDFGG